MDTQQVLSALAALAQESRLAIFHLFIEIGPEGLAANKTGEQSGIPASSLSFHIKELAHANLATARQESRFVIYSRRWMTW